LLLGAARLARATRAYATALVFLQAAVRRVEARSALHQEVEVERVHALCLGARFDEALAAIHTVLPQCDTPEHRLALMVDKVQALFAQQRMQESVDTALGALALLDVHLP